MNIDELQLKAGAKKYVSIFGKSTVLSDSKEYKFVEQVTEYLIENDYGVIHGGYNGGMMQAVGDTAFQALSNKNLPLERNIAVPQVQHDEAGYERVQNASFTEPAKDIFSRLKNVAGHSDIAVVAPLGGDGTLLEAVVIWHENLTGNKDDIVPLVVLMTEGGTNWKLIFKTLVSELDSSQDSIDELSWLYFASDMKEFKQIIADLA